MQNELEARDRLIESGMPLAHYAAKKYAAAQRGYVSYDEALSVASLGLLQAAAKFDPSLGWQFSTFAMRRIEGAIMDHRRETMREKGWCRNSKKDRHVAQMVRKFEVVPLMVDDGDEFDAPDGRPSRLTEMVEQARKNSERDWLLGLTKDKNEREILESLLAGELKAAIAVRLGWSASYVSWVQKKIVDRGRVAARTGQGPW